MTADLTIIVCTYNRPDWLAVSLASIRTSAAFAALSGITTRVLVVDDGSPGSETRRVATAAGADYVRNRVRDPRPNPSHARILGLEAVDSPAFAFFDDDDVMLPRWITLHLVALRGGVDVCSSAYDLTDDACKVVAHRVPEPGSMGDLLAGQVSVNDQSLVRTEAARSAPWDPELENVMLYQVWLDLMLNGYRFDRITEPTFLYRRHAANTSDRAAADPRDAELRELVTRRYRALVLERDGSLPVPTTPAVLRTVQPPPPPSAAQRLVRRVVPTPIRGVVRRARSSGSGPVARSDD
ncbi:MAG TPA: glycosyltransferase family A protein [Candidatus Binatus sp.]|nr:glycosyltransferase family A protein [Candidatus Binatus sp.]